MNMKVLSKINIVLIVSSICNFYLYASEILTGEHEEQIPRLHETEKGPDSSGTQEPIIEQQTTRSGETQTQSPIEPTKIDTEAQRVISLSTQEGGPAKFGSSTGSIEVTSSKNIISTVIETLRQFINNLRGIKSFEAIIPQLEALDKTINDIARTYKIDDLKDLNPDKLTSEDLQAIQKNLNQVGETLLALPKTSESETLRKELDDFADSIFEVKFTSLSPEELPPLYKFTLDDVTNPELHFKNGTEALTWLNEAKKLAEEAANSPKLSPAQKDALAAALTKVSDIEFNLVFARQELGEAHIDQGNFDNLQKQLETALNRFREPLGELTNNTALSPELEKLLFQEAYAILVVTRQAMSELIANTKMGDLASQQDQSHKEYLAILLNFAKENVKTIQSLALTSSAHIPLEVSSSEELTDIMNS